MLAQVELSVGNQYQANIVPKDAVIMQGPKRVTYLITEAETVQQLEIETGNALGNWIEVAGPLKPGDRVITRGNERLRPGQKVQGELLEYAQP